MTARQWVSLLLLGALGYGALAYLFPRFDPAAKWHFQLDRQRLIAQAQAFAAQQGIDVSSWHQAIATSRERNYERYLRERVPDAVSATFISPLKARLVFRAPTGNESLQFDYSAQGQLLAFSRTGIKPTEAEKVAPANRQLGEIALANWLGAHGSQFTFGSESEPEKGRRKFVWSYLSPTEAALKIEAEALFSGPTLIRLEARSTLPPPYSLELSKRDIGSFALFGVLGFVVNTLAVLAALLTYFLSLNRKEVDHLSTLIFFAVVFVLLLLDHGATGLLDEFKRGDNIRGVHNPAALTILPYAIYFMASLAFSLPLTAYWAAGEAVTAKYQTGRLAVFAQALRGKLFTRPVANNLAAGFLAGGFIAALPYLFAWLGGLTTTPSDLTSIQDLFLAPMPGILAAILASISGHFYDLLLIFAFLTPAFGAYFRTKWPRRLLLVLAGIVFLLELNPNQTTSFLLKTSVTLAVFLVFVWLYRYFDLFAVLAANMAAALSIKAFGLLVQPAPSLHAAGIQGLVALGLFGFLALWLTQIAPAAEIEPRRLPYSNEFQAERERLKAEFGVARRAQENLLPAAFPQIPGFGIAALCRPARECGGDLYDFIPLAHGKLGIVVADVSGKGVPAALYMTLTKGLLRSVSEEHSDPGEILRVVNKHLYEVCKRKVFVTLFFGVLDPAGKTLTYSRAGHNPPVWRKQMEQSTHLLKPAGIGLGLNAGKSFDRILAVETINLNKNDLLIFYSDGITEAMNEYQEEYGEERLMQVATVTDGMGAEESLSAVFAHVSHFLGRMLPQDDQTLVVVRVT